MMMMLQFFLLACIGSAASTYLFGVSSIGFHHNKNLPIPNLPRGAVVDIPRGGAVVDIDGLSALEPFLKGLVIIDFTATWCGPCKMIGPIFHELESNEAFSKIKFLSVDVDVAPDVASKYDVSAMPTFVVLKDGEVIERFSGANPERLKEVLLAVVNEVEAKDITDADADADADVDAGGE